MSRMLIETKQDWAVCIISFLVMLLLSDVYKLIYDHYLVKNGIIIEAVVTEKHNYGRSPNFHYAYKVDKMEYNGNTVLGKNISVNDTILVILSAKNINRSRAIWLQRNQATLSTRSKRLVVINNLSSDEKKALAERLMAELNKRYWVKQE